ncbi:hypothetical protein JHK85_011583 [Glycine max]|nr:hypothetical protein JHK85_011583 [Glycine max]
MVVGRITIYLPLGFTLFLFASVPSQISANESYVLTLDHSNFSDTISISSSLSSTHHGAGFFKSRYREAAEQYRQQGLRFLVGDAKSTKGSFQYFGVKEGQVPLIIVQRNDGKKFLKPNLEPDHISTWLKACKEENIVPYFKSEPISEDNNEPVKVVVGDSIQDIVFNSGKNVISWLQYWRKLSYQSDADVIIAKLDGIANYIPRETFEVISYPTVYFTSASGKISQYDGNRTKEDIIEFIEKNRDKPAQQEQGKNEL